MGTTQIWMIILSVIIVALTVGMGLSVFYSQAYNSNKRTMATEMSTYPPNVIKYWNTSKILGGANAEMDRVSLQGVAGFIGFSNTNQSVNDNGKFWVAGISTSDSTVTIKGIGHEKRNGRSPLVTATISLRKNITQRTVIAVTDTTLGS